MLAREYTNNTVVKKKVTYDKPTLIGKFKFFNKSLALGISKLTFLKTSKMWVTKN